MTAITMVGHVEDVFVLSDPSSPSRLFRMVKTVEKLQKEASILSGKVLYPEASFQGRPLNIVPLDQAFCTGCLIFAGPKESSPSAING